MPVAEADVRRAALADQLAAERASRETERRQRYGAGSAGGFSSSPRPGAVEQRNRPGRPVYLSCTYSIWPLLLLSLP